jgi:hypothetical protein
VTGCHRGLTRAPSPRLRAGLQQDITDADHGLVMSRHTNSPILAVLALVGVVVLAARGGSRLRAASPQSRSVPEDQDLLGAGWFWNLIAVVVVVAGIGCLVAATNVDAPACRLPGRVEAEDDAGSWVGGAIVASVVAFVAGVVGRSRSQKSRRRFIAAFVTLASAITLCLAAVGYWLVLIFPCATD